MEPRRHLRPKLALCVRKVLYAFLREDREAEEEDTYREQVRGYAEILSAAWRVTVRGFVWYIETGESFET